MPLYGPSTATATVAANTNSVAITGMDLNAVVQQGMTINFGARDRAIGDAWIINTVVPNGTNGGTLTTAGNIPTAYNSVPFLIDTRGFNGTDSSFAAAVSLKLLATLTNLLGTATNLFAGSRQLVLDKVASTAIGRVAFAIAGRTWGDVAQRSLTYTPTGGQAVTIETMALRAFPDGTTPTDALLFDLTNGTGDLRKGSATMVAGSIVDLGSAPAGKIAIIGAGTINSFGPGRNLERLVLFTGDGVTLVHSAGLGLPGRANIVARTGDWLHATSDGVGNWGVLFYQRADGSPLLLPVTTLRAGSRRRTRNGDFSINQREVTGNVALAANAYGHDGWKAGAGGCTYSATSVYYLGPSIVQIASGSLVQIVEGALYVPDGGAHVLSWAGSALCRVNGGAYAPSPIALPGLSPGANVTLEFGVGSLGYVQLELGSTPTPYEFRDDELRRCQRYYSKSYSQGTRPGTATNVGTGVQFTYNVFSFYSSFIRFPQTMRAAPTVTTYNNGTGASGTWYFPAANASRTAFAQSISTDGFEPFGNGAWPAGDYTYPHWVASAEL
ncbi:hypothetical protein [Methylorubrum sp. GM97]|uniref:hypothetical protein n=1 Tax=Methylorubrum sp. GM97 TaxID=2938232 RepID=UPI00218BC112|nr:hypothetical protein [Methylorubrum sp. GM97]BDL40916.1 hypothetical protein MSPGM_35060 [Methylorubrum sp. GM97]